MRYIPQAACLSAAILAAPCAVAQPLEEQLREDRAASVSMSGHVVKPVQLDPTPERIARLRVPSGFEISVFANDLVNPRMLAVADDGTVYVTRRTVGDVLMLRDTDGDGAADHRQVVANRPDVHGIAIDGSTMYLATVRELYRTSIEQDGSLAPLELLIDDLPDGGQHPNRTLIPGPDGRLYLSVGSTCNACAETNPENAALLRVEPDGSSRRIFASGLRNMIGFGFSPEGGGLWGMDHGIDWLGDNAQHEELNRIVEGSRYGWPYIYSDGNHNPQDQPEGITMEEWAERSVEPVGLYVAHSAPMQMAFYDGGAFPEEYRGDAFVAMRGSWNRNPPSGYEIMRIRFEGGEPAAFEPFVTGFVQREGDGWGFLGRLAGLAQAADGSLLVTDDTNGVIYRVAYTGENSAVGEGPTAPTNAEGSRAGLTDAAQPEPAAETPARVASDILGSARALDVRSAAFRDGSPIPAIYGADGENISPHLEWEAGPDGTRSYVILMEDPAAAEEPPFVHWMVYNIPANVTELEEGRPATPRLQKPEGALQGMNDRGSLGYFGPRPPLGDPPHPYHFQVFAIDSVLDLPFGATRAELLEAMTGRVLAQGTIIGTFQR